MDFDQAIIAAFSLDALACALQGISCDNDKTASNLVSIFTKTSALGLSREDVEAFFDGYEITGFTRDMVDIAFDDVYGDTDRN